MTLTDLNSIRHTFTEDQMESYIKLHQNILITTFLSIICIISYCIIYY
jgi:hypothetical protein